MYPFRIQTRALSLGLILSRCGDVFCPSTFIDAHLATNEFDANGDETLSSDGHVCSLNLTPSGISNSSVDREIDHHRCSASRTRCLRHGLFQEKASVASSTSSRSRVIVISVSTLFRPACLLSSLIWHQLNVSLYPKTRSCQAWMVFARCIRFDDQHQLQAL